MGVKFKAIFPKHVATFRDFQVAMEAAEGATAREAVNRFRDTVKTWEDKPKFKFRRTEGPPRMRWEVFTVHEVYYYVNEGTPPHPITPRSPGGTLAFPSYYGAKSRPGFLGALPGGPSGPTVFAKFVDHPGIEPRHFDRAVTAYMQKRYTIFAAQAIEKTAKKFS